MLCYKCERTGNVAPIVESHIINGEVHLVYEGEYHNSATRFGVNLSHLDNADKLVEIPEHRLVLFSDDCTEWALILNFLGDYDEAQNVFDYFEKHSKDGWISGIGKTDKEFRDLIEKLVGHMCYAHTELADYYEIGYEYDDEKGE